MPRGSGIYEDDPRDHAKKYTPEPGHGGDDDDKHQTPDDLSVELTEEPPD